MHTASRGVFIVYIHDIVVLDTIPCRQSVYMYSDIYMIGYINVVTRAL